MLYYKGLITKEPGINAKPIGNSDKNIIETLMFYDDELCDKKSCFLVQEQLQNHFKSETADVYIQVHYEKEDNRVIIGMTIILTEHIKCPRCGYNGPMNRFSSPEHTKLNKSELGSTKKHKMIVEHYCPICKSWVRI